MKTSHAACAYVAAPLFLMLAVSTALAQTASEKETAQTDTVTASGTIQVHGHWVIEIRNPDGSLDSRREFDNALLPSGTVFLASLLGRQVHVAEWSVAVRGSDPAAN